MFNGILYRNQLTFSLRNPDDGVQIQSVIGERLKALGLRKYTRRGNTLSFTAGMMRLKSNWNVLNGITAGTIEMAQSGDEVIVCYELLFSELLAVSVFSVVSVVVFSEGWLWKIVLGLLALAVVYGLNVVISIYRFRRLLQDCINSLKAPDDFHAVSAQQKMWMDNSDQCSACGAAITSQHHVCPDCGITLR